MLNWYQRTRRRLAYFKDTIGWRARLYMKLSRPLPVTPVLVYQMGKVGSSSIFHSLVAIEYPVTYHVHTLHPQRLQQAMDAWANGQPHEYKDMHRALIIRRTLFRRGVPMKIIAMVRDPIARNISDYFENFEHWKYPNMSLDTLTADEMVAHFKSLPPDFHQFPLIWFDIEFKPTLDIDIYAHEFPKDVGYTRFQQGNYDILLYKSEISLDTQERIIQDFIERPDFKVIMSNVSSQKPYAQAYKALKQNIRFDDDFLDMMYTSKYAQHFYTDEELAQFRARWGMS